MGWGGVVLHVVLLTWHYLVCEFPSLTVCWEMDGVRVCGSTNLTLLGLWVSESNGMLRDGRGEALLTWPYLICEFPSLTVCWEMDGVTGCGSTDLTLLGLWVSESNGMLRDGQGVVLLTWHYLVCEFPSLTVCWEMDGGCVVLLTWHYLVCEFLCLMVCWEMDGVTGCGSTDLTLLGLWVSVSNGMLRDGQGERVWFYQPDITWSVSFWV